MNRNGSIDIGNAVQILRCLANPVRLQIALHLLSGEQSVADLETALHIRQPNLSQQLAELRKAGLVVAQRQSRAMIYSLADDDQRRLIAALITGFGGDPAPVDQARDRQRRGHHRANPHRQVAMFATVAVGRK